MLTPREKNQKLIELQLAELSDRNIEHVLREVTLYLVGQKKKEMVQIYLEKDTYVKKEIVGEGARTEIIKTELPKPPQKKKRPRIVKITNNIEVNISSVNSQDDEWLENHRQKLSDMMNAHVEGGE